MFLFLMNILYLRDKIAVTYILNYSVYYIFIFYMCIMNRIVIREIKQNLQSILLFIITLLLLLRNS